MLADVTDMRSADFCSSILDALKREFRTAKQLVAAFQSESLTYCVTCPGCRKPTSCRAPAAVRVSGPAASGFSRGLLAWQGRYKSTRPNGAAKQLQVRAVVADRPPAPSTTTSASQEKIKIGINGFGRIGRLVARYVFRRACARLL